MRSLRPRSVMKLSALVLVSAAILFSAAQFRDQEALLFLLFISIILQLWIVHTETELCALAGIALFSALIVVATNVLQLGGEALMLQFVLITLAANSYLGLAVPSLYSDNDRLRELLTHDVLTGALSRAFFEERAREGIEAARHRCEPAALVMIDLNGLKLINDRYGHAAGDAALRRLVHTCQRYLQAGEVLGRLSGDEFAIFLPETNGFRVEERIARIKAELAEPPQPVGASFGLAELSRQEETYEQLLHRADQAMYQHKP
jgi:diguanylate cyclase (GGDEF)-like protein